MAIIGKDYYAVLVRTVGLDPDTGYTSLSAFTTLYYHHSRTSPEAITDMYEITADFNEGVNGSTLATYLLGGAPGDDPEERMLETASYQEIVGTAGGPAAYGRLALAYTESRGGWLGPTSSDAAWGAVHGAPEGVWAMFPDNPLWADTTETPFGDFGNGLIHYQFITRWPHDPELDDTERHEPFATPPTDYINPSMASENGDPSTGQMFVFSLDWTYIFMPVEGEEGEEPPPPESTIDDDVLIRVWGYKLDSHKHFVLRIGENATLVYDLSTDQWAWWKSVDRENWRPHVGMNWVGLGATTAARGYGTNIVCGDDESGALFILDPTYGKDDAPDGNGFESFERIVTGGISLNGREVAPCNALTLDLSLGAPSTGSVASIELETSDDLGHNFLSQGTQNVASGDYSAVIEWRSLGIMRAPGRIFRLTDTGATVRIGRADLR